MSGVSLTILDNLDKLAMFTGGLFAGTALYISFGEVPAMRKLGLNEHWRFFPLMYERAVISQGMFAATAGIAGIIHGTRIIGSKFDRNLWIIAGSIFFGMIPYTFICISPTTNKLIIDDNKRVQSQFDSTTKQNLLNRWTILHLVRTLGSLVSFSAMVFGNSRH